MVQAWELREEGEIQDETLPNQKNPPVPVSLGDLEKIGVYYFKIDGKDDPKLQEISKERGYTFKDEVQLKSMLPKFYEEHVHDDEEIRFCLQGSGYFDVRGQKDEWIRVAVEEGDLIVVPAGMYHRFTLDSDQFIHAMRLFAGEPVWVPHNRPCDDRASRVQYVKQFLEKN
eukprot:CAMPEP_0201487704 /NCGR_PEP_ID=MMETSP0151_2-20130828/15173_1 /ASSEMBLY_ACC=CAM_ASM_000257 /TAXON_ID=200890 /ORGANISM="Paramoeba atlantica, Strain 621/1 / CCAP 1560/9" /LENGTH=170 /DNA_ID=CAMNT_0047872829 /DNA_START=27 /DNA_END=539 /DNA_ORIENTATION=+